MALVPREASEILLRTNGTKRRHRLFCRTSLGVSEQ